MPDILFAVESDESRSLPLSAQRLVNFFTEKERPGAKSQTPLFGAPGLSAFANTSTITGAISGLGTITGGSGYGSGTYSNVPLSGGSGSGAVATITVSGGAVTAVHITQTGVNYLIGDVISASNYYLGGAGSGFSATVSRLSQQGIAAFGAIVGGGGYGISASYANVALTGGTGSGATANIAVTGSHTTGGSVTAVELVNPGAGYLVGDRLSASAGLPAGTGFSVTVAALGYGGITRVNAIVGGSGYNNASSFFSNVPFTGGSGSGATGDITITAGSVSAVTVDVPGMNYVVGDVLGAVVGDAATGQIITAFGSGYVPGTYDGVPLTGGTGTGAQANLVVGNAGLVAHVALTVGGVGYVVGDLLSASNLDLGGSGSGFQIEVTTVSGGSGFAVPVAAINTPGPVRGSWVRQDIPYVVAGNSLYQLSSSANGTYSGVPLTGGNGSGATANITITGGVVTAVALQAAGANYQVGDVLSAPLGGGTGFSVPVATLNGTGIATLGAIAGGSNYLVGSVSMIGSGIGGTDMVGMSDNGFQLCIVSGQAKMGWILDTNPQSFTYGFQQITDPAFYPANTVSFFDGYFIFDRIGTNEFFLSNLYDGTAYNALDFASAESQPDFVTGTIQNLQLLFIICQEHLELWYDAGGFPFPFARYTGAGISYGCVSPKTIIKQDGAIFFLGADKIFYRLQSTVPIRTSTHSVETVIAKDPNIAAAYCFTFTLEGHKMVGLTLPASQRTMIFDVSTGRWHDRESWDQNNASLGIWRGTTVFRAFNAEHYVGDAFNGNVNLLDWSTYTELGNTIRGLAYSVPYHKDRKRLFVSRFELDIQAGVGLPSGYGSDPQIQLGWSIDGAQTFQPLQFWRSMGKIGQYLTRLRWLRMGNARQFVFVISCTDPVPRVIIAAHADISIGM